MPFNDRQVQWLCVTRQMLADIFTGRKDASVLGLPADVRIITAIGETADIAFLCRSESFDAAGLPAVRESEDEDVVVVGPWGDTCHTIDRSLFLADAGPMLSGPADPPPDADTWRTRESLL